MKWSEFSNNLHKSYTENIEPVLDVNPPEGSMLNKPTQPFKNLNRKTIYIVECYYNDTSHILSYHTTEQQAFDALSELIKNKNTDCSYSVSKGTAIFTQLLRTSKGRTVEVLKNS